VTDLLDGLARALVEPMPRRRAMRLMGATVVAVAVPGMRPRLARGTPRRARSGECGADVRACPRVVQLGSGPDLCCGSPARRYGCEGTIFEPVCVDLCGGPNDVPCKSEKKDDDGYSFFHCCKKPDRCVDGECVPSCPPGRVKCRGTCCPAGFKCCPPTKEMPKGRCYDPDKQCCTPVAGLLAKRPIRTATDCPDRVEKRNHTPRANGCGPENGFLKYVLPNRPFKADFKPACDYHDICYETCRRSKSFCDRRFRELMDDACRETFSPGLRRGACIAASATYFTAVSKGGDEAYDIAQKEACASCC
jgi:group XII secretory phospholipase A2 precursor (PLA2G12)